jgi:hypothetical protein
MLNAPENMNDAQILAQAMHRRRMLTFVLWGIAISEAIFGIGYGWLRYRYSLGIGSSSGLWWLIILVALVGAMLAILTYLLRRNPTLE